MKNKEFRVLLAVPSRDEVNTKFYNCILSLILSVYEVPFNDKVKVKVSPYNVNGSVLPEMRQKAVNEARRVNATHLLFIDSDMTFPPTLLHRWLMLNLPIVAANCVIRKIPSNSTARKLIVDKDEKLQHYAVRTTKEKADKYLLEEVHVVGTGVMLIELDAIKNIPAPHFEIKWNEKEQKYVGEDWYFCELLRKHNIPIIVDHFISWQVGHVGVFEHTHQLIQHADMYESLRQEALRANEVRDMSQENAGAESKTNDRGDT